MSYLPLPDCCTNSGIGWQLISLRNAYIKIRFLPVRTIQTSEFNSVYKRSASDEHVARKTTYTLFVYRWLIAYYRPDDIVRCSCECGLRKIERGRECSQNYTRCFQLYLMGKLSTQASKCPVPKYMISLEFSLQSSDAMAGQVCCQGDVT